MPRKPVSLTVHRNTRERRKRRELRDHMLKAAKGMTSRHQLGGFVLVGWTKQYGVVAAWDAGDLPGFALPDFVRNGLHEKMRETTADGDDDGSEAG